MTDDTTHGATPADTDPIDSPSAESAAAEVQLPSEPEAALVAGDSTAARRPMGRWVVATLLALAAVLLVVFAPYPATIDGAIRFIPRGATVADLARSGAFRAASGDLMSVNGAILTRGGGGTPVVTSGSGTTLDASSTIGFGASVTSARGSDKREDVVARDVPIPPDVTYVGSGSGESVVSTGAAGKARVTQGVVSHIELKREVVVEPQPRVIVRGPVSAGVKYIALTFDDGPWPGQTEKILDILKEQDAKATFFMLGLRVQRNRTLAKRVVASGNEVATHSQTHKLLAHANAATIAYEIGAGATTVRRFTGVKPYWYRPAGGSVNPLVYARAKALGLKVILWNLDTHDYTKPGAAVIAERVIGNAKNGSVVLMHDGGGDRSQTIAALPMMIRALRARGFVFVTVSELFNKPNPPKLPTGQ